jgi:ABC-type transporter Mla MlaB component
MPWHLGWSSLEQISADAMPLLAGLFSSLCDEPVSLRFSGANNLVQVLRAMTPSGDRGVDAVWWDVRLNALRTLQLQDEFELAALDYCVTYEVAPPAWQEARCQCESVPTDTSLTQEAAWAAGGANAATAPMGLDGGPATKLELRGEVLGDATQALAGMDGTHRSGDAIVVSCSALVRVDFSAAGSILNWVAVRQSEGCQVQFRDVNRMVAAFFSVIGISEHARVVPRSL